MVKDDMTNELRWCLVDVFMSFFQEGVTNWSVSQVGDQIFLLISSVPTGFSSTLLLVAADTLLERVCMCVRACVRVRYFFQECFSCICSHSAQRSPRTQMLYKISSKKPFLATSQKIKRWFWTLWSFAWFINTSGQKKTRVINDRNTLSCSLSS